MLQWAVRDLAVATATPGITWLVAVFHHAPYSRGSHDSDVELEMVEMRTYALPILEAAGVDVVLSGHSHSYERSFLIDASYGLSTAYKACHSLVSSSADTYYKPAGFVPHAGAVYVVAGSSGQLEFMSPLGPHPVMSVSKRILGSTALTATPTTLTGMFITTAGTAFDRWTITKVRGYVQPRRSC